MFEGECMALQSGMLPCQAGTRCAHRCEGRWDTAGEPAPVGRETHSHPPPSYPLISSLSLTPSTSPSLPHSLTPSLPHPHPHSLTPSPSPSLPHSLTLTLTHLNEALDQLPIHPIPSGSDVTVTVPRRLQVIEPCLEGLTEEHVSIVFI